MAYETFSLGSMHNYATGRYITFGNESIYRYNHYLSMEYQAPDFLRTWVRFPSPPPLADAQIVIAKRPKSLWGVAGARRSVPSLKARTHVAWAGFALSVTLI